MSQLLRNRSDGQLEQNVSQSQIDEFLTSYVIYGVEGLVLGVSNLLIAFVVLLYSDLRVQKEYVIVAGQSFANGLQGLAFVAAGIGRSSLINAGNGTLFA
uniref:Uncharacterized protein n=1 Tax=Plectus sambesii TaxID=2011161 RepID=A0A914W342_9BILA